MATAAQSRALDFGDGPALESGLSSLARSLRGSIILAIAADVRELVATGQPVCNLTVGDFDPRQFPVPVALREGIIEALRAGETNYPPSDGILPLREAVVEYIRREYGVEYPVASVLISAGGRPAIYAAFRCLLDPGSTALYSVPSWNNDYYVEMVDGRKLPVRAAAANRFQPVAEDLVPHLSVASLLCLCSPGNPTGTIIDDQALGEILTAVVEENCRRRSQGRRPLFVLHDLMYGSLIQPEGERGRSHPLRLVPEAAPWLVVIDGASKAFAATGLRVGWVTGPPAVITRMRDFLGHVGAWAPRPEQVATAAFLRDPHALSEFRGSMNRALGARLDAAYQGFRKLARTGLPLESVRPQGAMYVSLGVNLVGKPFRGRVVSDNEALRRLLLTGAGLAAVPFQAFGVPEDSGWFRLSVGAVSVEEIEEMLPRVERLLS